MNEASPAARPLRLVDGAEIRARLALACSNCDGLTGAHCIHELWMRGELAGNVEAALERLWQGAAESIPDWLPMRHIEWLPTAYEVAGRFRRSAGVRPTSTWCCSTTATAARNRWASTSA